MIHWTDIEKSKEGIFRILEVIKNYATSKVGTVTQNFVWI